MFFDIKEPRDRIVLATCGLLLIGYAVRSIITNGENNRTGDAQHSHILLSGAKRYYLTHTADLWVTTLAVIMGVMALIIIVSSIQLAIRWYKINNRRDIL